MELKLKRRRYKSFKIPRKEEGDRYSKFKIRFRIFMDQAKVNHLIIKNFSRKPCPGSQPCYYLPLCGSLSMRPFKALKSPNRATIAHDTVSSLIEYLFDKSFHYSFSFFNWLKY